VTTTTADSPTLAHALYYASLGWRVIPIIPGEKSPAVADWPNVATTDADLIRQWFTAWPGHGVGVATGPGSGFWVLDVDPRSGGDDSLHDLTSQCGNIPQTVEAITGGGGRHILFRHPTLEPNQRLANASGRLGPGLDVKAAGGQIVVAPTIHPSGVAYEWEASSMPGATPLADAPQWLLDMVIQTDEPLPEGQVDHALAVDLTYAWDAYAKGAADVELNRRAVTLLTEAGWHSPRVDHREGWIALTRPGKASGISASVGKIAPGVVHIFTSDGGALEEEGTYSPPQLLAVLRHNGSKEAADAALVAQGLGAPTYALGATTEAYVAAEHARALSLGIATATAQATGELREARAFLAEPEPPYDWLVEDLIERGDRLILTGPEGGGKSTLLRQMAVQIAAGIHPFDAAKGCRPARVLIVDCENSPRHIRRKLRPLVETTGPRLSEGNLWIVPKPEGIDLAAPVDMAWLWAICAQVEPELLIIGPIYKMSEGDPTEETTAKPIIRALDALRAQWDCAVLIEAHTPHEGKTERPYGASIWKRWPEFGLYLDRLGPLRHWRGARDERQWPGALARGHGPKDWPWEVATAKDITYAAMVGVQRAAICRLSVRQIADAMTAQGVGKGLGPVSKSTVHRAIHANLAQWNRVLEELGYEAFAEVEE
jgi:hypothetical protein